MSAKGVCPVCNGTLRVHAPEGNRFKSCGFDAATVTNPCRNCGDQYQFSSGPTGAVPLNRDGQPCTHEYTGRQLGNCYRGYDCKHCGDSYSIDSGD
jgi:hypothetical protein